MIKSTHPGLTSSARRLIHQQYGFRTDAQSVTNISHLDLQKILNYETNELGNTDIPDTLNSLYAASFKPNQNGQYPVEDLDNFIQKLVNPQGFQRYYLIWLVAEWQSCFELYADGYITPQTMYDVPAGFDMPLIDVYQVHPDDVLISDLGTEGQLIATQYYPEPMHGFNHDEF